MNRIKIEIVAAILAMLLTGGLPGYAQDIDSCEIIRAYSTGGGGGAPPAEEAEAWFYPGGLASTDFNDGYIGGAWGLDLYHYGSPISVTTGGTAIRLSIKSGADSGTMNVTLCLYDSSKNLLDSCTAVIGDTLNTWYGQSDCVIDTYLTAGTYYVMARHAASTASFGYDDTATLGLYFDANANGGCNDPFVCDSPEADYLGVRVYVGASGTNL